jgi:membrane protein YdbS with pleckstrin-like domain
MRKWRYAGVLIIPIVLALEVAYYQHLDGTGMLIVPMVILLILAVVVGLYALMSEGRNDD